MEGLDKLRLKCMVVDDEIAGVHALKRHISRRADLIMVHATTDPLMVEEMIEKYEPDVLFADLHMDELHGIDLIKRLQNKVYVVCCTAHNNYASETFALNVIYYLLKPFGEVEFDLAIARVKERVLTDITIGIQQDTTVLSPSDTILLRAGRSKGTLILNLVDIEWIEARDDESRVYHTDGCDEVAMRIGEIEVQLPPSHFMRVHKGYLIALNRVRGFGPDKTLVLRNVSHPNNVLIGRTYLPRLKEYLAKRSNKKKSDE